MQVKFAIKEGYNHDSIVTSLIAKKLKGNVNRNAKKRDANITNQCNFYAITVTSKFGIQSSSANL